MYSRVRQDDPDEVPKFVVLSVGLAGRCVGGLPLGSARALLEQGQGIAQTARPSASSVMRWKAGS